jgi:hypothetical protein
MAGDRERTYGGSDETKADARGGVEPGRVDLSRFAFDLDDDQLAMREAAEQFARERVAAGAVERDRARAYPLELVEELARMGLLAMKVPVDDGGAGADNLSYALAMQAIAQACASVAVILASSNLVANILDAHASPAQRERYLQPYAGGELGPAAFALTEPGAGSDAAALKTAARRNGDDWIIDGAKHWITSGAHAGLFLVFARTEAAKGTRGISAFIVERGAAGLEIAARAPWPCTSRAVGCRTAPASDRRARATPSRSRPSARAGSGSRRRLSASARPRSPRACATPASAARSTSASSTFRRRASRSPTAAPISIRPGC